MEKAREASQRAMASGVNNAAAAMGVPRMAARGDALRDARRRRRWQRSPAAGRAAGQHAGHQHGAGQRDPGLPSAFRLGRCAPTPRGTSGRTTAPTDAGAIYDVIDAKGELIDRVKFPFGRVILGFGPGVVYMGVQDGDVGAVGDGENQVSVQREEVQVKEGGAALIEPAPRSSLRPYGAFLVGARSPPVCRGAPTSPGTIRRRAGWDDPANAPR